MEILNLSAPKSFVIFLGMLVFWKFFYYKYHKKLAVAIMLSSVSAIFCLIGIYYAISNLFLTWDILALYYFFLICMSLTVILENLILMKHQMNNNIDITLTFFKKIMPFIPFWFWFAIAFPALFFIIVGANVIFGKEYIILGIMVSGAWVASLTRLFRRYIRNDF